MRAIYKNGTFFTMNANNEIIEDGMLIVENTMIQYIGPYDAGRLLSDDTIIDLKHKWALPGLVNTHSHILMTILRGVGDDMPLNPWLETRVFPLESQYTTEIATISAQLGIMEMLRSGTTACSDMFNPNGIDVDEVMHVVAATGMTGAISYAVFSFGTDQEQHNHLLAAERFANTYKSAADGRLTTMVAPHSTYACSTYALEQCARIAQEHNLMVHIHLSETEDEVNHIKARYGVRPVEYARRLGIFNQPTIAAHGVVLNDEERAILQAHDVRIAHNPISNLKLGSGIANISKLLELGIKVGIGTDGVASNNNYDMFEELRTTALLQKGLYRDATKLPASQALALATRLGGEVIGMPRSGSLEVNQYADFITIDPHNKPHLQPEHEAISHLVYSVSGKDVSDVYIRGQQVVKNSECLTIDEERVISEANRLYAQLRH
jgi:5-methylthioadenosine/S-adenosylhomocysteine deaminase